MFFAQPLQAWILFSDSCVEGDDKHVATKRCSSNLRIPYSFHTVITKKQESFTWMIHGDDVVF
jgi:hypothetical protein